MATEREVVCFLAEETAESALYLRRYSSEERGPCPLQSSYHNAHEYVRDVETRKSAGETVDETASRYTEELRESGEWADLPWPLRCVCGYEFLDDPLRDALDGAVQETPNESADARQVWTERILRNPATAERWPERSLPIGAIFRAWWLEPTHVGEDGVSLAVVLPPGGIQNWWLIDFPATDGTNWQRTGTPPRISTEPSVLTPRWHGWVRDGRLVAA
jgi:hypothetical protein